MWIATPCLEHGHPGGPLNACPVCVARATDAAELRRERGAVRRELLSLFEARNQVRILERSFGGPRSEWRRYVRTREYSWKRAWRRFVQRTHW